MVPSETICLSHTSGFSVLFTGVFILLLSWALRVPVAFRLYVGIASFNISKPHPVTRPNVAKDGGHFCRTILNNEVSVSFLSLGIVSVRKRLEIFIPVPLVFWYITKQSSDYGAAVTFNLPVCLLVIRCCCGLLYPEKKAESCKKIAQDIGAHLLSISMKVSHVAWHNCSIELSLFALNWFWL